MTKIGEIRETEIAEKEQLTKKGTRDLIIQYDKGIFTKDEASTYVQQHDKIMEQNAELRKKEGSEYSEIEKIESNEELEPVEKLKEMIEELEGFDKVVEKQPHFLDIGQYRFLVNTGKQLIDHLEKTPHLLNLEEFDRFIDTGKQFVITLGAMEQSDISMKSSEISNEFEVEETELRETVETPKSIDTLRGLLVKLDDIWSNVEDRPEIMTEDLHQTLTRLGKQWTKDLERIEHAEVPEQDTESLSIKGLFPWTEVHKSYPYVWQELIESFQELDNLIRRELPEILTHEGIGVLMDDARNHFKLLKEVEPRPSTISVEKLAEKLNIDSGKAIDWIIYNEWPSIYEMIETKLPEGESSSTITRIKSSLDEFEQGAGER